MVRRASARCIVRRKPRVRIEAQMHGGGHERGMRSGTLATHQIVGMGEAFRIAREEMATENERIRMLRDRLLAGLSEIEEIYVNGDMEQRVPHNLNISFNFVEGESLIMAVKDVAVSSGSACTSASLEPSYVLRALGRNDELAHSSIRFTVGRFTTEQDVDYVINLLKSKIAKLRDLSPLWEMHKDGIDISTDPVGRALSASLHDVEASDCTCTLKRIKECASWHIATRFWTTTKTRATSARSRKDDDAVGTGMVGAPACGDVMKLQIRVGADGIIEDAKFKTYGCGSAIASSSLVTEWVKGKTLDQALTIKNTQIAEELALPPVKIHCSILAEDAIKAAVADYKQRHGAAVVEAAHAKRSSTRRNDVNRSGRARADSPARADFRCKARPQHATVGME